MRSALLASTMIWAGLAVATQPALGQGTFNVGGVVYEDPTNPLFGGAAGVTVTLSGPVNDVTVSTCNPQDAGCDATTLCDGGPGVVPGIWLFCDLPEGTYTLTFSLDGECFNRIVTQTPLGCGEESPFSVDVNAANAAANQNILVFMGVDADAGCTCDATPCSEDGECDDGNECTTDTCDNGFCLNTPIVCDDENPCTVDRCDTRVGCSSMPEPDGTACENGDLCTTGDTCQSGDCLGGQAVDCSDLDGDCTVGVCNANNGICVAQPANEGQTCSDGDNCTTGESCQGGTCSGGTPVDCSDLDGDCTAGVCNPNNGICEAQADNEGGACDDGQNCTTGETCQAGACTGGSPIDCSFLDDDCNAGFCQPDDGQCETEPANDGGPCDDGDACTENGTCDIGICFSSPVVCDDQDACTTDTCDPGNGCQYDPIAGCLPCTDDPDCDDGNDCTSDICEAGVCEYGDSTAPCDDGDACTTGEACQAGACSGGSPLSCNDEDACTTDTCDPATGCVHTPIAGCGESCSSNADCEDGNACTDDICSDGVCEYNDNSDPCEDGDLCTTGETCNGGACSGGSPVDCSDLDDQCNTGVGNPNDGQCEMQPANEGAACEDPNRCSTGETCQAGACTGGTPIDCSHLDDDCNAGVCNLDDGQCETEPANDGGPCDDGDACTENGTCDVGICFSSPVVCDDQDACTTDTCDPATGCEYTPIPGCAPCSGNPDCEDGNACTDDVCSDGVCQYTNITGPCEDGDLCTTGETCQAGACTGGTPVDCSDLDDQCNAGVCNPGTGQCETQFANQGGACNDGDACTENETCDDGECVGGTAVDCDDGNACTFDICDGGCINVPLEDGSGCDDGDACTTGDTCNNGECSGAPIVCDPGFTCVGGQCVQESGFCINPPAGDLDCDGLLDDVDDPCVGPPGLLNTLNRCAGDTADCGGGAGEQDCAAGTPLRLNLDGGALSDCAGTQWFAETAASGNSGTISAAPHVAGISGLFGCSDGATQNLVLTNRYADPLLRSYPIADGDYVVNMIFSESYSPNCAIADRVFDIAAEGVTAYAGFDQYAVALALNGAGCGSPVVRSAIVTVADGTLDLSFDASIDNGSLKAVEVVQLPQAECETAADCPTPDNPCLLAACVEGSCQNMPDDGAACDDGDACTTGDTCDGGECSGLPLDCSDGDPCTEDGCDSETGCYNIPLPGCLPCSSDADCDDGNPCTDDVCNDGSCDYPANEAPCDDGNACTTDDACNDGACSGTPVEDETPCGDEDICNGVEICLDGVCQTGDPLEDGTPCDDGSVCTEEDTCLEGTCTGDTINCSDGDRCTDDACDPLLGCVHDDIPNCGGGGGDGDRDIDDDGIDDGPDNCNAQPNGPDLGSCLFGLEGQDCQTDDDCDDTENGVEGFCSKDQENLDGDGLGDVCDPDRDGDGVANEDDGCPDDGAKIEPGFCGCGNPETDSDGDGRPDCVDQCPSDAGKTEPGQCGCGTPDLDSDQDQALDCQEDCPLDAAKVEPGQCGCGEPDTDSDGDGVADCVDDCPEDSNLQSDQDSDGDGILDCNDICPNDPTDTCGEPQEQPQEMPATPADEDPPTTCGCNPEDGMGSMFMLLSLSLMRLGFRRRRINR